MKTCVEPGLRCVRGVFGSLLVGGLVLAHSGTMLAAAPPEQSAKQFERGDYEGAVQTLEAAKKTGRINTDQLVILGRTYFEMGRFSDVAKVASTLSRRRDGRAVAVVLHARVGLATGLYTKVIKMTRKEVRRNPTNWGARILLSEALLATGTSPANLVAADEMADYWNNDELTGADELSWLGRALHLTGYAQEAFEIFHDVLDDKPNHQQTLMFLAQLLLDKEDEAQADLILQRVLRVNSNHLQARTLSAHIDISSDNDYPSAQERLKAVLAINPLYLPALQVQAHAFIHTEQCGEALTFLYKALKVNANSTHTLAMISACQILGEDATASEATLQKALQVNSRAAAVYHTVADYMVVHHRYTKAVELEREALRLDPEYGPSYVGLGIGYSRLGDDEKANFYLQKAFEQDSYNRRAYNMTALFYDGPAKRMNWHDMVPFRVRLEQKEEAVLGPLLKPFLREAYAHHSKVYGFRPQKPLHIELFSEPNTFSIRTTGYPRLGAHGVCFGHVVTAQSPSAGNFNWGMVMWHELAHIWHIQMSKSRVPRWFTEGLAEHETTLARPAWRRELDRELWEALQDGRLKGIASFNTMFTQAKSFQEIVLAYYYASKVVAFIDDRWGFEVFPKMLRAWGDGSPTGKVFKDTLGQTLEAFDTAVIQHLRTKILHRFTGEFGPWVKGVPPDLHETYRRGLVALDTGKHKEAAAALDEVLAAGADGSRLRSLRAVAAVGVNDFEAARTHLERAVSIDPANSKAYRLLAQVLGELEDKEALYGVLQRIATLEEHDVDAALAVVMVAEERSDAAVQDRYSRQALEIAPFQPRVQLHRVRALLDKGHPTDAQALLDRVASMANQSAQQVGVLRARIWIALGRSDEARTLLESLKKTPAIEALLKGL